MMNNTHIFIPDEFKDKRVLVTGGTKGAGEAIVRRFGMAGASVATAARSPLPQGQKPAKRTEPELHGCRALQQALFAGNDRAQEWCDPAHFVHPAPVASL